MMYTTLLFAAAVATATAQSTGPVYNSTTGQFVCPANNLNGDFCAGDSLTTNIIIRCNNGVGQPGNCNDNLSGYFPFGVNYAPCWQSSPTAGDAACSKNCIVEGGSGNSNGTFTLPNCTPLVPSTTATTSTASSTGYPTGPTTTTSSSVIYSSSTTSTVTCTSTGSSTTQTSTYTTTYCPPTTTPTTAPVSTTTYIYPTGPGSNTTVTTVTTPATSATNTPVGPSGTTTSAAPTQFTGAAVANSAGAGVGLAAVGIIAAYFL